MVLLFTQFAKTFTWFLQIFNILNVNEDVNHFFIPFDTQHSCVAFFILVLPHLIYLYKLQNVMHCIKVYEDLCCWQWVRVLSRNFGWDMLLKQSYVRFWHLHNDNNQTFAPKISHSPPNLEVVLLVKLACLIVMMKKKENMLMTRLYNLYVFKTFETMEFEILKFWHFEH
jgi:hypothetical protein